uniref:Uncharacterized protein n=1 Tax=Arundo donax TaxID=35708 RepID=A0A0A9CX88_ARUDO
MRRKKPPDGRKAVVTLENVSRALLNWNGQRRKFGHGIKSIPGRYPSPTAIKCCRRASAPRPPLCSRVPTSPAQPAAA